MAGYRGKVGQGNAARAGIEKNVRLCARVSNLGHLSPWSTWDRYGREAVPCPATPGYGGGRKLLAAFDRLTRKVLA